MINKPIISDKFYPHGKPQINHTVLFTTHSDPETREGKVLESTTQDYKVIDYKYNKTIWINQTQITSNLGPNYKPRNTTENTPTPELPTGTYIYHTPKGTICLVEKEKFNGKYYYRKVDHHQGIEIQDTQNLYTFSEPHEGKYILEPGIYVDNRLIVYEVIPHLGKCWIRLLGESELEILNEFVATTLHRVEADTDDNGIIMIETPLSSMEKTNDM